MDRILIFVVLEVLMVVDIGSFASDEDLRGFEYFADAGCHIVAIVYRCSVKDSSFPYDLVRNDVRLKGDLGEKVTVIFKQNDFDFF